LIAQKYGKIIAQNMIKTLGKIMAQNMITKLRKLITHKCGKIVAQKYD